MKLLKALAGLCVLLAPLPVFCQAPPIESLPPERADIPAKIAEIMRLSEMHFREGSDLIKSGECARARAAFDEAVDLILQSEYDLTSTPVLNSYFLDLISRIQRDESIYLQPQDIIEETPESAVVDELGTLDLIPIKIDPSLKDVVEADLLDTRYDIPVVLNDKVFLSLNYWLNQGRRFFVDGLVRSGQYEEMIQRIFREESIPLDLMYLAQVESLFKTNALSRALAKGIWQFSRSTGIRYGLKVNRFIDERSDPEKSTRAAARYLRDLYAMFEDWNLVLAAYNWGEGKVQRLINRSGKNDFWELTELRRNFPRETKNHVPMILSSIILARNPEKYGLPEELDPPLRYDRVPIEKRVSLKAVAKVLDVTVEDLKKLNPALRGYYTPPDYPEFELKVPEGKGSELLQKMALLPSVQQELVPVFSARHKVQPGETLSGLAVRYRTSILELQEANDIRSPKSLRAGTWIQVPPPRQSSSSRPSSVPESTDGRHLVQPGETLGEIAARYRTSVATLLDLNGLRSPRLLRAGTWIQIPDSSKRPEN